MDYKKEYEAMVQRARELHEAGNDLTKRQMEIVCPELEGSEDERIRAEIVEFLLNGIWAPTEISRVKESQRYAKWIAYLEKQKEQNRPDKCKGCNNVKGCINCVDGDQWAHIKDKDAIKPTPKQDYSGLTDFERAIHRGFLCAGVENVPVEIIKETAQDCLAQMKPAEWDEEDEGNITDNKKFFLWIYNRLLYVYKEDPDIDYMRSFRKRIDQLFSKPHWKPSEEQMKALLSQLPVIKGSGDAIQKILESLYNDLKRL